MSSEYEHPPSEQLARALAGEVEEPDREVPCMRCKVKTLCPGFLIASIKLWNHDELKLASQVNRIPQYITYSEIVPCDACGPLVIEEKRAEYILECTTTQIYLRELRAGKYNPESLKWLRRFGHGDEVQRKLSETGSHT